jgi:hypothetical protein
VKLSKYNKRPKKGEVMNKNLVIEEAEVFHRVWNFVVPLDKMGKNNPIQSIPPLTKTSFRKNRRRKTKKVSVN